VKKSKMDDNPWKMAGLMGALGTDMVLCLVLGYFGGSFISERMGGHKGWIIAGVMTGLVVGIVSIVLIIKRFMEDTDE
jgi:ATP synthase protein I